MTYKDPVEEFEKIDLALNEAFGDIFKNMFSSKKRPTSKPRSKVPTQVKKANLQRYDDLMKQDGDDNKYKFQDASFSKARLIPFPIQKIVKNWRYNAFVEVFTRAEERDANNFIKDVNSGVFLTKIQHLGRLVSAQSDDIKQKEDLLIYGMQFQDKIVKKLVHKQGAAYDKINNQLQSDVYRVMTGLAKLKDLIKAKASLPIKPVASTTKAKASLPIKPVASTTPNVVATTNTAVTTPGTGPTTAAPSGQTLGIPESLFLRKMVIECLKMA